MTLWLGVPAGRPLKCDPGRISAFSELQGPLSPLGLDHMLFDSRGACDPEVLIMEPGTCGFLRPFWVLCTVKLLLPSDTKTLLCLFHFHTLMVGVCGVPEAKV